MIKRSRQGGSVERTLRAWRPTTPSDLASATTDTALAARQLVTAALGQLKLGERVDEPAIAAVWAEIVGPALARHSRPCALRNGVLTIGVSNPAIQQELRGMRNKRDILIRLQQRFGGNRIRDIMFRHDG